MSSESDLGIFRILGGDSGRDRGHASRNGGAVVGGTSGIRTEARTGSGPGSGISKRSRTLGRSGTNRAFGTGPGTGWGWELKRGPKRNRDRPTAVPIVPPGIAEGRDVRMVLSYSRPLG